MHVVLFFLRNNLSFIIFNFNVDFKMVASIDSHFENIKSRYLQKKESDFYAIWIKMFSFPNTLDKIHLYFCDASPLIVTVHIHCCFTNKPDVKRLLLYLFSSKPATG